MGELRAEYTRVKELFSFSYSDTWLKSRYSQILDPELQLYAGSQYAREEKPNFGLFLDSLNRGRNFNSARPLLVFH